LRCDNYMPTGLFFNVVARTLSVLSVTFAVLACA